ncbi:MAG: hypothetical protein K2I99_09070 [Bacteroidaceae bacterium]|nr:hypothetical protein [Bacteroidaceae bacterium]
MRQINATLSAADNSHPVVRCFCCRQYRSPAVAGLQSSPCRIGVLPLEDCCPREAGWWRGLVRGGSGFVRV